MRRGRLRGHESGGAEETKSFGTSTQNSLPGITNSASLLKNDLAMVMVSENRNKATKVTDASESRSTSDRSPKHDKKKGKKKGKGKKSKKNKVGPAPPAYEHDQDVWLFHGLKEFLVGKGLVGGGGKKKKGKKGKKGKGKKKKK